MIQRVKRLGAGLVFALFGFVSLVVADKVGELLCAHLFACRRASACPIDVCEGDARLNALRLAVWVGPAVVFGASAFVFAGRPRPLAAWMALLATLVVAHVLVMTAAR
jgi:hypothetical protein